MQPTEQNIMSTGLVWKIYQPEDCENPIHLVCTTNDFHKEELLQNSAIKKIFDQAQTIIISPFQFNSEIIGNMFCHFQEKVNQESQKYPNKVFTKLNQFITTQFKIEDLSSTAKLLYDEYCRMTTIRTDALNFIVFSYIFIISQLENKNIINLTADLTWNEALGHKCIENLLNYSQQIELSLESAELYSKLITAPAGLAVLKSFFKAENLQRLLEYASLKCKALQNGDMTTYMHKAFKFFADSLNGIPFDENEVEYFKSKQTKKTLTLEEIVATAKQNNIEIEKDLQLIEATRQMIKSHKHNFTSIDEENDDFLSSLQDECKNLEQRIEELRIKVIRDVNKYLQAEGLEVLNDASSTETIISRLKTKYTVEEILSGHINDLSIWDNLKLYANQIQLYEKLLAQTTQRIAKTPSKLSNISKSEESLFLRMEELLIEQISSLQRKLEFSCIVAKAEKIENGELLPLQQKIDLLFAEKTSAMLITGISKERLNHLQTHCQAKGYVMEQITIPIRTVGFCWEVVHRVSRRKGTLVGTIHHCSKKVLDLNSEIFSRFRQADVVAVETDITRKDIVKKTRMHLLEHNQQIKSFCVLDETSQQTQLDKWRLFLEKLDIKFLKESKNKEKQFIIYLETFLDFLLKQIGRDKGIETLLISQAKELGKPVVDLEIFEDHVLSLGKKYDSIEIDILKDDIDLEEMTANFKQNWKKQYNGFGIGSQMGI
jgi:uncharacterized protein YbaP (TraB family)